MMKVHENIRARRIALKMTQQELAKKMGYKSTSTIAKIESGENDIPQAKIAAFAEALNTTPAELMGFNFTIIDGEMIETLNEPDDTVTVTISKGKPQLEELIRRLDGLSEKKLNRVVSFVNQLLDNFLSGEDFRMEIKSELRPVE
ncbi:MAG: helix-turn-helix transcriptional regulator [Acidaminococcaceae bacterium]|nr:helix-turn-helix transcriptional regulator [Acidaminococcaceae bacterium]